MPDSNQIIIDRVRSGTGTTAMEYTEYRVDVLALCNFAEQVLADLARMTAERDDAERCKNYWCDKFETVTEQLRASVAELESSCRDLRVAYEQNASQCVRLNRELALKSDTVEWLNGVTIQRQRAEQAERRNAELVAALRDAANALESDNESERHTAWNRIRDINLVCAESATPAKGWLDRHAENFQQHISTEGSATPAKEDQTYHVPHARTIAQPATRCGDCAPEFGCWDGGEPCYKKPLVRSTPAKYPDATRAKLWMPMPPAPNTQSSATPKHGH